jgi:hypothetical protein
MNGSISQGNNVVMFIMLDYYKYQAIICLTFSCTFLSEIKSNLDFSFFSGAVSPALM